MAEASIISTWPVGFRKLYLEVNCIAYVGRVGERDPENPCGEFDDAGYDGTGDCMSDGHYVCTDCSKLSPEAPRFNQSREGRVDRLRLFWSRNKLVAKGGK